MLFMYILYVQVHLYNAIPRDRVGQMHRMSQGSRPAGTGVQRRFSLVQLVTLQKAFVVHLKSRSF